MGDAIGDGRKEVATQRERASSWNALRRSALATRPAAASAVARAGVSPSRMFRSASTATRTTFSFGTVLATSMSAPRRPEETESAAAGA